jgi:hypothetical protein
VAFLRGGEGALMGRCEVCGNEYDKSFTVTVERKAHVFDSFECAVHALAPRCDHCGCRVIGHGVEADDRMFCGAHCATATGARGLRDRADSITTR